MLIIVDYNIGWKGPSCEITVIQMINATASQHFTSSIYWIKNLFIFIFDNWENVVLSFSDRIVAAPIRILLSVAGILDFNTSDTFNG